MFTCNLTIYRGTLFLTQFIWSENGIPVDLTDYKAKAQIKSTETESCYELSTDGGQIGLGTAGEIDLVLNAETTATMLPGSYAWDILLKNPQGDILPPIVAGTATVLQGVTVWQP